MEHIIEIIPTGTSKEEIKVREKVIKDFYARWVSEHPDKKIWNENLQDYILVIVLVLSEPPRKLGHYKSNKKKPPQMRWLYFGARNRLSNKGCHPFYEFPFDSAKICINFISQKLFHKTGTPPNQEDVFNAFGELFGKDFSKYYKDLSEASKKKNEVTIFEELEEAFREYEEGKLVRSQNLR